MLNRFFCQVEGELCLARHTPGFDTRELLQWETDRGIAMLQHLLRRNDFWRQIVTHTFNDHVAVVGLGDLGLIRRGKRLDLSLIHISEPTRLGMISYAVFCL